MAKNRYERPTALLGTCGPCAAGNRERPVGRPGLETGARTVRRSRWGVGPQIGLVTVAWTGLALVLHWAFYPAFAVTGGLRSAFQACGAGLLGVGIPTYAAFARHFSGCSRGGALLTTGPYARVRHPLYAVWVFLLAPGAALLVGSWLLLSVPLVMYVAAWVFIPGEEAELEKRYGDLFRDYRRRTGRLVPRVGPCGLRGKQDAHQGEAASVCRGEQRQPGRGHP
jgi:protein-S-isoprenylcysteine O-methyltransferase Ste14